MYCEHAPPPHLARHVECFWSVEGDAGHPQHLVLPDGCEDIVFLPASGSLVAAGAMTRARRHPQPAGQVVCGVRFHPGMARPFLVAPASCLTDSTVELAELWGARGEQLRRRLTGATNRGEIIRLLGDELLPAEETKTQKMILWLVMQRGRVPLADLARFAGLSQRQLRRVFLEQTGLSPKFFCRVLRFRALAESAVGNCEWAQLALDHGYYDQSHLVNDFKELSGLTPGEFKTMA